MMRERQPPAQVRPFRVSRRALLRGAAGGVAGTLALPRLEAMLNAEGTAYADGARLPATYCTWFWGNGNDPQRWVPQQTGAAWTPSPQLLPFAPVKEYVSVVTNMRPAKNLGHLSWVAILTGDEAAGSGRSATVKSPTVDTLVSRKYDGQTRLRQLDVRVADEAPPEGGNAIHYISYNGPNNPNRGVGDPRQVYETLFGDLAGGGSALSAAQVALQTDFRRSALDVLLEDTGALRRRLGRSDQARLDQHLDGLRALEARLSVRPASTSGTCAGVAPPAADLGAPRYRAPGSNIRKRHDAMARMIAMAFACDITRVATVNFTKPGANVTYPEIGINTDIHEHMHTSGIDDMSQKAIVFWMECFASFVSILRSTPDAAGNVLDRNVTLGTSCIAYGPKHLTADYPLVLAGRAGGALRSGLHVRTATEDNASRVPFTVLRAFGLGAGGWGVGALATDKPLPDLLV